jgi:hypothetical protein
MPRQNRRCFAYLRKLRRVIAVAVLPAFAWWSLSASACFAMATTTDQHEVSAISHDHADAAHAAHGAIDNAHDHASMPDCPHCPVTADEDGSGPTICVAEGSPNANGPKASSAPDTLKLFCHARLTMLSWTAAPPPLIRFLETVHRPAIEHTPLNIRHCVFLI